MQLTARTVTVVRALAKSFQALPSANFQHPSAERSLAPAAARSLAAHALASHEIIAPERLSLSR